jgi:hypothetical protein
MIERSAVPYVMGSTIGDPLPSSYVAVVLTSPTTVNEVMHSRQPLDVYLCPWDVGLNEWW